MGDRNICVYGASSTAADENFYREADTLGRALAEKGYGVVFGAGNMGVMGAVARGAHAAGGRVIGVIPEFMNVDGIPYAACDELIVTQTMRERKQAMEDLAGGFIAAPGGIGTLEELLEIITLKQLARHTKPIVVLNTQGYYDHLLAMLEHTVECRFMKEDGLQLYAAVDTPRQAVEYLEQYVYAPPEKKWFL